MSNKKKDAPSKTFYEDEVVDEYPVHTSEGQYSGDQDINWTDFWKPPPVENPTMLTKEKAIELIHKRAYSGGHKSQFVRLFLDEMGDHEEYRLDLVFEWLQM